MVVGRRHAGRGIHRDPVDDVTPPVGDVTTQPAPVQHGGPTTDGRTAAGEHAALSRGTDDTGYVRRRLQDTQVGVRRKCIQHHKG